MLNCLGLLLALVHLVTASPASQLRFSAPAASQVWTTLGPFPLGMREGPLLPPLLPDLSRKRHPSPLVDGGNVNAQQVSEQDGWIEVGDASVRWNALRSTAGWSVLQHQQYYERTLSLPASGVYSFALDGAAEFSVRPLNTTSSERRWYNGNLYSYPNARPRLLELEKGDYQLTVTYTHDVRINGEPGKDGVPRGKWRLHVQKSDMKLEVKQIATPSAVRGWLMGQVLGLEVSNVEDASLLVTSVRSLSEEIKVNLASPVTLVPFQTRPIDLRLSQSQRFPRTKHSFHELEIEVALSYLGGDSFNWTVNFRFPISRSSPSNPTAFTSTFLSNSGAPSYALYTPPTSPAVECASSVALLALHGAGVEVSEDHGWTSSINPRKSEWIVWPSGLTPWGYDWHGASLRDVNAAVDQLEDVKSRWSSAMGGRNELDCPGTKKLIVLGHSNGGQGAWHYMSHYPDRVLGGVPASGYVKIQDYVPYHLSVGQHYRDPALTGILMSGLSSFDNDLYASNLADVPILSRHGGDDDNVPVQHSRQLISLIDSWSDGNSSASYSEVAGAGHWFSGVLSAPIVDKFISRLLSPSGPPPGPKTIKFTLTTANPDESGSKEGIRIVALAAPGRLARIEVEIYDPELSLSEAGEVVLRTTNVLTFSLDPAVLQARLGFAPRSLVVNGGAPTSLDAGRFETFALTNTGLVSATTSSARRYGPIISILNTPHPLRLVVGTRGSSSSDQHLMDIARRIAHDAWLYGKVDCEIVRDEDFDAEAEESEGNVVLLGDAFANSVTATWAELWPVPVSFISPLAFRVGSSLYGTAGHGLLSTVPHPTQPSSLVLILAGVGAEGLERAARLFSVRTGVPLPDWVVSAPGMTSGGIAAAGFWSAAWGWSDQMSYP